MHPDIREQTDYLCAIGTMGDLGANMKWEPPWPAEDMRRCIHHYGKKTLSDAVRLVNARESFFLYVHYSAKEIVSSSNCVV